MYAIATETQNFEYARLHDATSRADKLAAEGAEITVQHVETGAVVYVTNARALAEGYFHPWTRVETPKFQAPDLAGWVPAYVRKRIQATVYRSTETRAWLIHDGRTGGTVQAANTKEACAVTKEMRLGRML